MPRRIDLPPHLRGSAFSVSDGAAAGVGAKRMRGADLVSPFPGVRLSASVATEFDARCRAYLLRMRACEVFSHVTAARLWGIPLPAEWSTDEPLHVAVPAPWRASRGAAVRGHQLAEIDLQRGRISGLPVIDPVSCWLQLGRTLSIDDLVVAGDYLVRVAPMQRGARRPFATIEQLSLRASRSTSRGVARARTALPLVRQGSDSPQETRLRLALVRAGLPEPDLNVEIRAVDGRFVARVDMLYRGARVVVEYDGDQHRTDSRQYDRDIRRTDELYSLGYRVVRLRARQLVGPTPLAIALVRDALAGHAIDLPPFAL
ncbi:endonuclease domain-containing protein [Herbiconiux liangxiaofengii]|uniref:endonuclease domain-containing protein n=1 Tax=Herbiconiux liangxiaofengii TaxID=3342795 RepID=UPI0035B7FBF2